ncbi:MAG TPA: ATP-binding protein [Caulobacteraceae bacterium]|nr:ATP-binding protein [Caulobacteraceae bacterium]
MRPRLSSAPVFVQVFALMLATLIVSHAVNFAVLTLFPAPPPAGLSIADAARALKGEAVTTPDGKRLQARQRADAPTPVKTDADVIEPVIRGALARELGVRPDAVFVDVRGEGHARKPFVRHLHDGVRVISPPPHAVKQTRALAVDRREVMILRREGTGEGAPRVQFSLTSDRLVFPSFSAALRQPDGRWLVVEPPNPLLSPWQLRLLTWFMVGALLTAPLAYLLARRLTRPIRTFADAADRLGRDPHAPPLPAEGPAEVRVAVSAFNDMQAKLRRYVEDRTAMVAAIAHDLRTPLMRLRFRIESAPPEAREKMEADIAQMDGMVSAVLAFVRGDSQGAPRVRLDLRALAQSVVDDLAELGMDATMLSGAEAATTGDPVGLRRMLTNLVENAVKFGDRARVSLAVEPGWAVLSVEDDGPGVPAAALEQVFEPFHRLETSRSRATGGVGLGLAVARSVARDHGGDIRLQNRPEGGLTATVRLPAAP